MFYILKYIRIETNTVLHCIGYSVALFFDDREIKDIVCDLKSPDFFLSLSCEKIAYF